MNIQEYYDMLSKFDWYYHFSDDHRVWTAGQKAEKEVIQIAAQSDEHKALYEAWAAHVFKQLPKPQKPGLVVA